MEGLEVCATCLHSLSNAVMLARMCRDPTQRVSRTVLGLQIAANCLWCTYAAMRRDSYFAFTTASSTVLQLCSLYLVSRAGPPRPIASASNAMTTPPRRAVATSRSRDALLQVPPWRPQPSEAQG
jgi:hypothetical protein